VLIARGRQSGPVIVVLGGVHGDEYEGMAAVREVYRTLDPWEMRGTFIGVPVCNPPAFAEKSRTSPIDGLNLARVFPGQADGTISQQIAHVLTTAILTHADFLIDLHSSGSYMAMAHLIGYFKGEGEQARISREAALRFGIPLVWGHESVAPGRSLSPVHERGIPWLYTECPSGGWLHEKYARSYADGVRNVMRYLAILPGTADPLSDFEEIIGEGDTDKSLTAPVAGFLRPLVELHAPVRRGQVLGVIEDLAGATLAEITAPSSGMLILRRNTPSVVAGDLAFLLT
jgi:predicted deacylase